MASVPEYLTISVRLIQQGELIAFTCGLAVGLGSAFLAALLVWGLA